MSQIMHEITPLSDKDCFYVVERHKSEFLFPIHSHPEFELNFIENGAGVRRIVGDSVEEIGDYELTLVAGEQLEHAWEQGNCRSGDIREITIQFSPDLFSTDLLHKNQFARIEKMLEQATHGVSYPADAILKVYHWLDTLASQRDSFQQFVDCLQLLYELSGSDYKILSSSSFSHASDDPGSHRIMKVYSILDILASESDGFEQFQQLLRILYLLSNDGEARVLASTSFAQAERSSQSRRIRKVQEYINTHYAEEIRLEDCAALVGMAPSAFSRFFRQHTGRTLLDYIIDIRLGHAARMLVDTTAGISEISYACGFNNLSNFNRTFKARRGYTPRDFRTIFKKSRVFV